MAHPLLKSLESLPFSKQVALGFSLARTAHFATQSFSLPVFELLFTGKTKKNPVADSDKIKAAYTSLYELLSADAQNFKDGIFPAEAYWPESFKDHVFRYPKIIADGYRIAKRRDSNKNKDFSEETLAEYKDLPDYFKRNFHFQTDGYLSEKSAELYEHQVEILFSGAADPMRRMIIKQIKDELRIKHGDHIADTGEGLKFLELAAGTGRLTRFMRLAFPMAEITVSDISEPYLKVARKKLSDFKKLNFVTAPAEKLPFSDQEFDVVYSCFLFHELPREVRSQVFAESRRVAKDKGFVGLVDSVQVHDGQNFLWALEQFPQEFHEPFYKNYTQNPVEDLGQEAGMSLLQHQIGFLSKSVLFENSLLTK